MHEITKKFFDSKSTGIESKTKIQLNPIRELLINRNLKEQIEEEKPLPLIPRFSLVNPIIKKQKIPIPDFDNMKTQGEKFDALFDFRLRQIQENESERNRLLEETGTNLVKSSDQVIDYSSLPRTQESLNQLGNRNAQLDREITKLKKQSGIQTSLKEVEKPTGYNSNYSSDRFWKQILTIEHLFAGLRDVEFSKTDSAIGFLVGNFNIFFRTFDGGKTWQSVFDKNFVPTEFNHLVGISFFKSEGWVVGRPAVLFHTADNGFSWRKIQLPKVFLKDLPQTITALEENKAEVLTTKGKIYSILIDKENNLKIKCCVKKSLPSFIATSKRSSYNQNYVVTFLDRPYDRYAIFNHETMSWSTYSLPDKKTVTNAGFWDEDTVWILTMDGELVFHDKNKTLKFGNCNQFGKAIPIVDLVQRTSQEWVACGKNETVIYTKTLPGWDETQVGENSLNLLYFIKYPTENVGFMFGLDEMGRAVLYREVVK